MAPGVIFIRLDWKSLSMTNTLAYYETLAYLAVVSYLVGLIFTYNAKKQAPEALHYGKLRPYLKVLSLNGEACQGQTL